MKHPIKTFEPNFLGRDFVIGDLHGSYSCLLNLLKNINFNTELDRLFSVGDLIDRGPESLKCLNLLRHSWFHAVLANHEQLMLEGLKKESFRNLWIYNGGDWCISILENDDEEKQKFLRLLNIVEELPFLITVNNKNGKKFHILHAELPNHLEIITDKTLANPEKVQKLATSQCSDGNIFLWGRYQFASFYNIDLTNKNKLKRIVEYKTSPYNENLSHIISGHTILHYPISLEGQTNIDTGAYKSYSKISNYKVIEKVPSWAALTCICLDDWTFFQTTETEFKICEPIVL